MKRETFLTGYFDRIWLAFLLVAGVSMIAYLATSIFDATVLISWYPLRRPDRRWSS
jgi:hypothetical protein